MNTPSHAIINLAALGKPGSNLNLIAVLSGVLPDVPIFIFYFFAKWVNRLPDREIWSKAYYQPFWQDLISLTHSIPLAALGAILAHYQGWRSLKVLFLGMVLHSLCDLPVHHDDAHRHFFPFSNWRFISPFSYWDPTHYGAIVALIELLLVLGSTLYAFQFVQAKLGKIALVVINGMYAIGYVSFYVIRK